MAKAVLNLPTSINSALKDSYGGRTVRVRGYAKVFCHLMFGILALTAEEMMRLVA